MIEWEDIQDTSSSSIGEIVKCDSGYCAWWYDGDSNILVTTIEGTDTIESAKAAVIEAERAELQRRAEMIDCVMVNKKELERLKRIEALYDCIMNDKPAPELFECSDEEPILPAIKKMPNQDFKILKDGE